MDPLPDRPRQGHLPLQGAGSWGRTQPVSTAAACMHWHLSLHTAHVAKHASCGCCPPNASCGCCPPYHRLQLTASNVHGAHAEPTEAAPVVLGLPDAPTVTEVTPTVGKVALKWTAPQTNGFIGTKCAVQEGRVGGLWCMCWLHQAHGSGCMVRQAACPSGPINLQSACAACSDPMPGY